MQTSNRSLCLPRQPCPSQIRTAAGLKVLGMEPGALGQRLSSTALGDSDPGRAQYRGAAPRGRPACASPVRCRPVYVTGLCVVPDKLGEWRSGCVRDLEPAEISWGT